MFFKRWNPHSITSQCTSSKILSAEYIRKTNVWAAGRASSFVGSPEINCSVYRRGASEWFISYNKPNVQDTTLSRKERQRDVLQSKLWRWAAVISASLAIGCFAKPDWTDSILMTVATSALSQTWWGAAATLTRGIAHKHGWSHALWKAVH